MHDLGSTHSRSQQQSRVDSGLVHLRCRIAIQERSIFDPPPVNILPRPCSFQISTANSIHDRFRFDQGPLPTNSQPGPSSIQALSAHELDSILTRFVALPFARCTRNLRSLHARLLVLCLRSEHIRTELVLSANDDRNSTCTKLCTGVLYIRLDSISITTAHS